MTEELKEEYKKRGNSYYTNFYKNIDTKSLFGEIFSKMEKLKNSIKEVRKKQTKLKEDRLDIISRQKDIISNITENKKEKDLINSENKKLYDSISYCHESKDYSEIEHFKSELTRKKKEYSILKEKLFNLESSINYYNNEFQNIRELKNILSNEESNYKSDLNELIIQKNSLQDLLNKSINPFKPVNIIYLFNTLNDNITSISFYTPPRIPILKRNRF